MAGYQLRALLFDFDGTLVRTREASWELFQQTNEKFALGLETPSDFYRLFDQNFYDALDEAAASRANVPGEEVREHFQTLLRTNYTPDLVPGVASVVRALAAHYTLAVLSSNTMETVRRILLANHLAQCFAHVFSGDVVPNKAEAIYRFLRDPSYSSGRRCSPSYEESARPQLFRPGEVMLITDTVGDVDEARRAGIRVAAVVWGMHRAEDLEQAGAEFVCIWPEELVAYLSPGESCTLGACSLPPVSEAAHAQEPSALASSSRSTVFSATPANIRKSRRVEAAARTADRLHGDGRFADEVHSQSCGCGSCGQSADGAESSRAAIPPIDPVLRRVLAGLGTRLSDVVGSR
jgi:phosphoglycolate phosphatase